MEFRGTNLVQNALDYCAMGKAAGITRLERKNGAVRWRARWWERGVRRSELYNTEKGAAAGLRRHLVRLDEVRTGLQPAPQAASPLFSAFAERWMRKYPQAAGNRERTIGEKQVHLKHHLLPSLGSLGLNELHGEAITDLFGGLKAKGLSPKSIKNIKATLAKILRTAVEWGELPALPLLPKIKVPDHEWDWLNAEESQRLLDAAIDPGERLLFLFALHTGSRFGEQRVIEWSDIDWVSRQVIIRRSMPHNTQTKGPTKSGKRREVPISSTLLTALEQARRPSGMIFTHRADIQKTLSLHALRERLERALSKAGLRKISWHDLRHSFASQLVSAGVSLRQVQTWMGHESIVTTERYVHLAPGGGQAISALDRVRPADGSQ